MKILNKLYITILSILTVTLLVLSKGDAHASSISQFQVNEKPINVAVLIYKFEDLYKAEIKQGLEKIQNENIDKVRFTFFDGKNNQEIQNQTINSLFTNGDEYDLLLINLVDTKDSTIEDIVNKAKRTNKPVVFFNVAPTSISSAIKNYKKVVIVGTDSKQSGIMQGKILVDLWNTNRRAIDKNNNNILEYVMLQGKINNTTALDRTKYSIKTIKDTGIQTKELATKINDWDKELAKNTVDALFSRYGDDIDAIIANNDAMAIGAIEALQKYGYNKENSNRHIVVVGVDGLLKAKELVDKGIMDGTVIQDPFELANTLYTIGMNLVHDMDPLKGTNYKFNETGVVIETPYYEYTKQK